MTSDHVQLDQKSLLVDFDYFYFDTTSFGEFGGEHFALTKHFFSSWLTSAQTCYS